MQARAKPSIRYFCMNLPTFHNVDQVGIDGPLLCGSMPIDYFYCIGRQEGSVQRGIHL